MKRTATALIALLLLLVSAPARAFVAQTITVDGVNDFDPSNLLDDDRNDTQPNCSPQALPMDLGRVYVTNDASYLYLGIEFAQTCFCNMNLGMIFDVGNTADGGSTDPFGRAIGFANLTYKPEFQIYDVTPTSCNTFNYEVLYKDTTVAAVHSWQNISTRMNPSWGSGSNGLGIIDSLNFKELKIPLSLFGLSVGSHLNVELWVTQESSTKGPLDALASDDVQMSHPNITSFDTSAVVQLTQTFAYTILNSVDVTPPVLNSAQAVGFTVNGAHQFALTTNKVDLSFSEPVDLTTAQTAGNYAYAGPLSRSVTSAVRDGAAANIVHLTLSASINANASAYQITVSNVKDVAGNTIASGPTTNVAGFFIQNVVFNGDFRLLLCSGAATAVDSFTVKGGQVPLDFGTSCAAGLMTDVNADSIYTITVPFCLTRNRGTLKNDADTLEWKFVSKCSTYEPLGSNRRYGFDSDNGSSVTLSAAWGDQQPAEYTSHAVDVIFTVDATSASPVPTDVITLLGNVAPLTFNQPGVAMRDDGVPPDAVSGDHVYSARVTFASCKSKSVDWKVDLNGTIECFGQGNRHVWLDDSTYSVASPYSAPTRGINYCTTTDKPIPVRFTLDTSLMSPAPAPSDTLAVMGSASPLAWDPPPATGNWLADDGTGSDQRAGDGWYTRTITFPAGSPTGVGYKFWHNSVLECFSVPDRGIVLDDLVNSNGNPIVLKVQRWDFCTDYTAVPLPTAHATTAAFAALMPVVPNPVAHRAAFSFDLHVAGHVTFTVYDVTGRRVARLVDGGLSAGLHTFTWEGLTDGGLRLANGVYLYELAMGTDRLSRRMILVH